MVIYHTTINDLVAAAYTAMAAVVNAKKAVVKAYELLNDTTNPNALSDDVQHFTSIDQPWEYIQSAAMEMNNVNNNMMDAARLVEEEVNIVGAAEEGEVRGGMVMLRYDLINAGTAARAAETGVAAAWAAQNNNITDELINSVRYSVEAVEKAVEKVAKKVSVMKMLLENPVARMNEDADATMTEADARPWSWVQGDHECKRMRVRGGKRKSKRRSNKKRSKYF